MSEIKVTVQNANPNNQLSQEQGPIQGRPTTPGDNPPSAAVPPKGEPVKPEEPSLAKKPVNRKRRAILLSLLVVIVAASIIGYLKKDYLISQYKKATEVTVEEVDVKMYKSRGTRDQNKEEKYDFKRNELIQAKLTFQKAEEKTVVLFKVVREEKEEPIMKVEIPIKDAGERFISLPAKLPNGNYSAIVEQKENKIKEVQFNISD